MPINTSLLDALQQHYGGKKGQSVYFGMENKGSKSFTKGLKTASKEGHTVPHLKNLKAKKSKVAKPKMGKAYQNAMADKSTMGGILGEMSKRIGRGPKRG